MYEQGPNAGEPATADADEYLRQYYAAKHRHVKVAERYALYEHGWNVDAKILIICYGIVSRVASPLAEEYALFRPIRIHPMLVNEVRAIADRYDAFRVSVQTIHVEGVGLDAESCPWPGADPERRELAAGDPSVDRPVAYLQSFGRVRHFEQLLRAGLYGSHILQYI